MTGIPTPSSCVGASGAGRRRQLEVKRRPAAARARGARTSGRAPARAADADRQIATQVRHEVAAHQGRAGRQDGHAGGLDTPAAGTTLVAGPPASSRHVLPSPDRHFDLAPAARGAGRRRRLAPQCRRPAGVFLMEQALRSGRRHNHRSGRIDDPSQRCATGAMPLRPDLILPTRRRSRDAPGSPAAQPVTTALTRHPDAPSAAGHLPPTRRATRSSSSPLRGCGRSTWTHSRAVGNHQWPRTNQNPWAAAPVFIESGPGDRGLGFRSGSSSWPSTAPSASRMVPAPKRWRVGLFGCGASP